MAWIFSGFFLTVAFILAAFMVYQFTIEVTAGKELPAIMLGAINTAIMALATFELGVGIGREYTSNEEGENIYSNVRRTTTRFIGVASIALVLEGLILVIKYTQLELAGNLFYPVAIFFGAGFLLVSLGVFLFFTRQDSAALHELLNINRKT